MDPASAFAIACGAFQLVQICAQTVKAGKEIWQSSSSLTIENALVANDAGAISRSASSVKDGLTTLQAFGGQLSQDQNNLRETCKECISVSADLIAHLDALKPSAAKTKRRYVPLNVYRSFQGKGKTKDLQARIECLRRRLDTELLVTLL